MSLTLLCLPGDILRMIYQMLFMDCYEMLDMISSIKRQLFGSVRDIEIRYMNVLTVGVIRDLNNYGIVCTRLREIHLQVMLQPPRLYTDIQTLTRYNCFRHYLAITHRASINGRKRRLEFIRLMG